MIQILLTSLLLTVAQASPAGEDNAVTPSASAASASPQDSESTEAGASNTTAGDDNNSADTSTDDEGANAGAVTEPTAISKAIGTLDEITQSGAIGLLRHQHPAPRSGAAGS